VAPADADALGEFLAKNAAIRRLFDLFKGGLGHTGGTAAAFN
jgi:hypothetical protein